MLTSYDNEAFDEIVQYVRYVELSLRFQDTVLGHIFGVRLITCLAGKHLMILPAYECRPRMLLKHIYPSTILILII